MKHDTSDIPYFLSNPKWYYYDEDEGIYRLTSKAPKKAIESYNEFYADDEDEDTTWLT